MKQNITLLLIMLVFTSLNAQITITNNDIAPEGETFFMATDTLVSGAITPGNPDANQTWDFTSLTSDVQYETKFLLPEWTPYASYFPNANFAASFSDDEGYAFFNRNDDELAGVGQVVIFNDYGTFAVDVIPKEIYFDFPVQYGDSREETFYFVINAGDVFPPFDSIKYQQTTNKVTDIDAWGSMTIQLGSYDVLRIKEERNVTDSIWGKIAGAWSLLSYDEEDYTDYAWIDATIGFTLVTMEYNVDAQSVDDVDFMRSLPVGVTEKISSDINIFPNPSVGIFTFSFNEVVEGGITIYDSQARIVSKSYVNSKIVNFDLSQMSSGLYFYKYVNNKGEVVKQGKLIKE